MIRVLLVEDDAETRAALRVVLEAEPDLVVVAEVADGDRALAVARGVRADVALVDLHLPRADGVEVTGRLRSLEDPPHVLVLTASPGPGAAMAALSAGASGILLKALRPGDLPTAVREVHSGRTVLAPAVTADVVAHAIAGASAFSGGASDVGPAPRVLDDDDLADLTARERELARAVGLGLTNAQLAGELGVAPASAKTYVSRLLDKLGLQNRTQLAILAHRAGLLG